MKKLVIVGCGRLAGIVSDAVVNGLLPEYDLVGVYSRTAEKAERIVAKIQQHGKTCMACTTIEDLGSDRDSPSKWHTCVYRLRSYRRI